MAKKDDQNLFQKLTKLFRSGPIVKRKIRAFDTTIAVADKTKSSGALLFQKSSTPTYASITANAYSLSERLVRYQDFCEMEYCLHGDTKIAVPGGYKTIADLAAECEGNPAHTFLVYAYDHNLKRIIPAFGKQARQTRVDESCIVTFDNGQQIIGTPNHRLMKRDGTFCKIEDLRANDAMMPFYRRNLFSSCKEVGVGYHWIYTMDRRSKMNGWVAEHRVIGEMLKGSPLAEGEVVHHRNFIKYDNRPENLDVMTDEAHKRLHAEILSGIKWSEQNSDWVQQFKASHSKFMTGNNPAERKDITFGRILEIAERAGFNSKKLCDILDADPNVIKRMLRKHGYQNFETFAKAYSPDWQNNRWDNKGEKNPRHVKSVTFDKICSHFSKGMSSNELADLLGTTVHVIEGRIHERGYKNYGEFSTTYDNLKVVSVKPHGVIPLYDLTVDGYKNFATDTVISHNTPELASALDIYCLAPETIIPLLDGTRSTVKELFDSSRKEFGVYSFDIENNKYVPGLCTNVVKTGINQPLFKITFDDGTSVRLTENHLVLLCSGEYKRVKDLSQNDSIRSLYTKTSSCDDGDKLEGYEQIKSSSGWIYTHRMVAEHTPASIRGVVHHCDFNKRNNEPNNLMMMLRQDHQQLHANRNSEKWKTDSAYSTKMSKIFSDHATKLHKDKNWQRNVFLARRNEVFASYSAQTKKEKSGRRDEQNGTWKDIPITWIINEGTKHETLKSFVQDWKTDLFQKDTSKKQFLMRRLQKAGYAGWRDYKKNYIHINHKIVSVEFDGHDDVFDLQVKDWHNFAIATESTATSCIIVHNSDETCAQDEKGRVLHIYSDNEKIKEILEELFYNTLNIEFNLRPWVRNIVKYGDMFLYNDVSPEHGVVSAFPIPVNEIEREENYDPNDPMAIRYRWVTLGNRTLENWEVTHFRLLGNDMFLPYGSSVIEPARRIWRQLILIEDAMLVYRVVRAPERRVFYIDVANIPPENVSMYVEEQRKNLRSSQVIDQNTARVDLRYNPLPVHKDTPIPLLDGSTMTIENLSKKMCNDPSWTPWVYSVQDGTRKIVPGKVAWCGKNYTATTLTKVWLDDGSYITTAPEHPFVMRDGGKKRADELIFGDSLMSAYRDLNNKGYERIVEPNGERNSTHVIVARDVYKEKWESTVEHVVHHRQPEFGAINKRNNVPENLEVMEVMNFWEHRKMHAEHCELTLNRPAQLAERRLKRIAYNKTPEKRKKVSELNKLLGKAQKMGKEYNGTELHSSHNEIRKEAQNKSWAENKSQRSASMQWIIPNEVVSFAFEQIKNDPKICREKLTDAIRNNVDIIETLKNINSVNLRDISKLHVSAIVSKIHRMGCIDKPQYSTFRKFAAANEAPVNHQVIKVETITDESADVYCMTVVGHGGEDDRHNFAVNGLTNQQNNDGKLLKSLIFVWNSVDEDYFIPVRGGETGTKIETLAGGQNTAAVEDVAYIQKKLFAALKIPRAYLGYDESLCLLGSNRIPLLDGRILSVEELVKEYAENPNKQNYVYSTDTNGAIKPGKVLNAWKTKEVDEFHRITLDDGQSIDCTYNHPFMCRDGIYRCANELQIGQSLMALRRKKSSIKAGDFQNNYEKVFDNSSGEWEYTHRIVAKGMSINKHDSWLIEGKRVIHHVDFDKTNNNPINLIHMGKVYHVKLHALSAEALKRPSSRETLRLLMKTDKYIKNHKSGIQRAWDSDDDSRSALVSTNNSKYKQRNIDITSATKIALTCESRCEFYEKIGFSRTGFENTCRRQGIKSSVWLSEAFNGACHNHKVLSIEIIKLDQPVSVYDIEVEKWHNFAVGSDRIIELQKGVSGGNDYVFVHNSSKATLAQEDIRFSRTISVIQKTVIAELNKLAIIHLYANGFDSEDLQNFTLRMSNPSTIAQQQKLELWRSKFEIAGTAPEGQMSKEFIRKEIWGLNDDECKAIDEQRLKEKMVDQAIENAKPAEEDSEAGEEEAAGEEAAGEEEEAGEEAGDLFADDNISQKNPYLDLLTSGDDPDDDEIPLKFSLKDVEVPVKAQRQLDRALYNRSRIRHSGPAKTHMSDFKKMTSADNKSLTEPYDSDWISSYVRNPFGESAIRKSYKTAIGSDVMSSLKKMSLSQKFQKFAKNAEQTQQALNESDNFDEADAREHREVLIIDDDGSN